MVQDRERVACIMEGSLQMPTQTISIPLDIPDVRVLQTEWTKADARILTSRAPSAPRRVAAAVES